MVISKMSRYLESLTVDLYDVKKKPLEGVDSESAMIGLDELRGEAVLVTGSETILYCSLSL